MLRSIKYTNVLEFIKKSQLWLHTTFLIDWLDVTKQHTEYRSKKLILRIVVACTVSSYRGLYRRDRGAPVGVGTVGTYIHIIKRFDVTLNTATTITKTTTHVNRRETNIIIVPSQTLYSFTCNISMWKYISYYIYIIYVYYIHSIMYV